MDNQKPKLTQICFKHKAKMIPISLDGEVLGWICDECEKDKVLKEYQLRLVDPYD